VEIWDADDPANEGNRDAFRERARGFVQKAREIFRAAHDQHKAAWEKYPVFIPDEEKQARAARAESEALYMQAQLDLAQCGYWEAQTYDRESAKWRELLTQASLDFEEIHTKYRSQIAGLYARLWQGKCFEEMDEIRMALGIYNELLEHDPNTPSMRALQDQTLRFRLICLNHDKRKDYQLVAQEAAAWLNAARSRARTTIGQGIKWELARALEQLGTDRTFSEAQQKNYLSQALNHARAINRYPGELKAPSGALIQRLMVALDRPEGDPKDFDTAYGLASQLLEETKSLNTQIEQARAKGQMKEAAELQTTLKATAAEMTRLYDIALKLADSRTEIDQVMIARLRLAWGYFLQEKFYESATVSGFVVLKYGSEFGEIAREAAFLQLVAFNHAYVHAPQDQRQFETDQIIAAAELLIGKFPNSDRATDARTTVANVYWNAKDYVKAAEWWAAVPSTATGFARSQVQAGQAYWTAYTEAVRLPEAERPDADTLSDLRDKAEIHIARGVAEFAKETPADAYPSELILGKLTLAQIRNLTGVYTTDTESGTVGAVELLTAEPHAVTAAVAVPEGQERPQDPTSIKSSRIASFAYQQLLRAYIGLRDLDKARQARASLESAAAGDDAGALTQVYVAFGQELQRELEQLKAAEETERLNEVRAGFESFLNDLFGRKDGQTFNSLLWIAETYSSLGEATEDDPAKSREYFDKAAATYRDMLDRAAADNTFFSQPQQASVVKLRLADSRRRQGDFEAAEQVMLEVVAENPNVPNVQFEAAGLYQDWAASGQIDAWQKYEIAIDGRSEPAPVWGWAKTAQLLQRNLMVNRGDEKLEQMHLDARYNLGDSYYQFAREQSDDAARKKLLEKAHYAVEAFVRISGDLPEDEFERFDALYQKILADEGQPVVSLADVIGTGPATTPADGTPGSTKAAQVTPAAAAAAPQASGGTNMLMVVLLLVVGAGLVGGIYYMSISQSKKRRAAVAAAAAKSGDKPRRRSKARV
ncbi:MAG: tetratricopeptide repeat protein, partial [Maioricimonas sp. JB049]